MDEEMAIIMVNLKEIVTDGRLYSRTNVRRVSLMGWGPEWWIWLDLGHDRHDGLFTERTDWGYSTAVTTQIVLWRKAASFIMSWDSASRYKNH